MSLPCASYNQQTSIHTFSRWSDALTDGRPHPLSTVATNILSTDVCPSHSLNNLSVQCDHHTTNTFCCTMCGPHTTNGHFVAVKMCNAVRCVDATQPFCPCTVTDTRCCQCCVTVTQPTDTFSLLRDSHTTNTYCCPCCDTQTTYIVVLGVN